MTSSRHCHETAIVTQPIHRIVCDDQNVVNDNEMNNAQSFYHIGEQRKYVNNNIMNDQRIS